MSGLNEIIYLKKNFVSVFVCVLLMIVLFIPDLSKHNSIVFLHLINLFCVLSGAGHGHGPVNGLFFYSQMSSGAYVINSYKVMIEKDISPVLNAEN